MDLYFIDTNGNLFVVPDAPGGYEPPAGAVPIDPPPGPGYVWHGEWVEAATILTPADIDAERDRRLSAGTTFADHLFQTDQLDRERIDRSRISAIAAIMGGAQKGDLRWHGQPVDFFWIAADNARVAMDAQTMVAFGNAVAAREGLLIITGNDLKRRLEAGEEIGDIGSDALWPA